MLHGVNVDAGIFMSYVGLWSYYNFDNWTYQPSYVSSNTPWFFNGLRVQILPTDRLKIEPWLINGWQSYGKFNHAPGLGGQVLWRPTGSLSVTLNNYWGTDTLGNPDRKRIHTDDSVQWKYSDQPDSFLSKAAMTFTFDRGANTAAAWDTQTTFDVMPSQFVTFRAEFNYRHASVPYFAGEGGVTPRGGNTGAPGSVVPDWSPDLKKSEPRVTLALLVKF